jgi:uncharacterized protein YjbJ (UPF0337 family)
MRTQNPRIPNPESRIPDRLSNHFLKHLSVEAPMNKDQVEGKSKEIKGRIKQGVGDVLDDENLRDEGVADEAEGEVQKGFGNVKHKVGRAIEEVGEKIKK